MVCPSIETLALASSLQVSMLASSPSPFTASSRKFRVRQHTACCCSLPLKGMSVLSLTPCCLTNSIRSCVEQSSGRSGPGNPIPLQSNSANITPLTGKSSSTPVTSPSWESWSSSSAVSSSIRRKPVTTSSEVYPSRMQGPSMGTSALRATILDRVRPPRSSLSSSETV